MAERDESGFSGERTVHSETSEVVADPSPNLVVLTGARAGRSVPLKGTLLVGRGVDCDLQFDVDDISRRHAEVRATEDGEFLVRDLNSQNGTWVNGLPVEVQSLRPGDRVRFGGKTVAMLSLFGDLEAELVHQQRLEALGVLASGIAHDFNNLMAVVLGNAEYLDVLPEGTQLGAEVIRETVGDLRVAAQHAADLSRQLLGLARKVPTDEQVLDVHQLIEDVMRIVHRKLGAGVEVEVAVREPLVLVGDPAQLRQVLVNLCVNANDAMPRGGRLVLRAWRDVREGVEVVRVEVSDTGIGMAPDSCRRVFEPFFTGKALGRGTGMGLAIAQRIVQEHGGDISVESALGEGATFRFWLPVRTKADCATPETRPAARSPVAGMPAPGSVLVIDDDALQRRTLVRTLDFLGYPTVAGGSAEEGLQLAQAMAPQVMVALLTSDLGGLGPVETGKALRRHHPEIKLVLTCGAVDESLNALHAELSADGVLLKPFDRTALRSELVLLMHAPDVDGSAS